MKNGNYNLFMDQTALNIIATPYEKVLTILNNAKQYINFTSINQIKLIKDLDWVIKIITSHSLYTYELKEKDIISKLSKENNSFKQFVDFVSEYNEQVIEINKKNIIIGVKRAEVTNELLQMPSFALKKQRFIVKKMTPNKNKHLINSNSTSKYTKILNTDLNGNYNSIINNNVYKLSFNYLRKNAKNKMANINNNRYTDYGITPFSKKKVNLKKNISFNHLKSLDSKINNRYRNNYLNKNNSVNSKIINDLFLNCNKKQKKIINNLHSSTPCQIHPNLSNYKCILGNNNLNKRITSYVNKTNMRFHKMSKSISPFLKKSKNSHSYNKSSKNILYSFSNLEKSLNKINYDIKLILSKEFNIFELKEHVGYNNILPLMGRVILDGFGLINDKIISIEKLDPFLVTVNSQYIEKTIYHNSIHGADVTQSLSLYFLNSNAEKISQTNVLDIMSVIISALGHDIGHPGLTNNYHINASTNLAITYNDISCLENFHCSSLFKIIRKDNTNIFEKLSVQEYQTIRKRMISEILATDMANHGKVITKIQSKIPNENLNNEKDFKLISGDEKTKFEEQQSLLDYFIHSADLAHNTKAFHISLKWVELLSKEFWMQGDKEKQMNLPVSFLCDRNNTDVPKSQVGFIGGIIIPTFKNLVTMFPTLNFTVENAQNNLIEWQKLIDCKRLKGWTHREQKEENKIENGSIDNSNLANSVNIGNDKSKNCVIKTNLFRWKPEKINIKK